MSTNERTGVVGDTRGAIMVVAVFMAAFMVGGLWYLIGIGDTIIYRERMQDGADSVAYAGAVYHARGMNLIAMINVIMAGILAVLVGLKLVQVMNTIALAISTAICAASLGTAVFFCGAATFTGNLVSPIQNAINAYQKVVDAALPALSKAQVGIAMAMPWVAEGKAVYVSTQYYKEPVQGGGIVSTSLVPKVPKERLGLPVQEDKYSELCRRAGEFLAEVVFKPFPFAGWMKGIIGGLVSTFPGYFCGGGGALGADFNDLAVDQLCQQKKKQHDDQYKNSGSPPKFDMDKCKKDGKKDLSKDVQQQVGNLGSLAGSTDATNKTSKKVFDGAWNGNEYMQVWSIVIGDDKQPRESEKGVEIAAWNKRKAMAPAAWGKVGFAQAEFYYDASGSWDSYKDDAMWNMKWRARMRRVHPPVGLPASILGGVLGSALADKLNGMLKGFLSNDPFVDFVIGATVGGKINKMFQDLVRGGGEWAGDKIEDSTLASYGNLEVIH